jgi:hypothetical protein
MKIETIAEGIAKAVRTLLKFVMFWVVVAVIGYILWIILVSDQTKLSTEYAAPEDRVFVQPKPHGCAYNDAPLGDKHCHFEKVVDVQRACPDPDCRVTAVYVSWRRVEE